MNQSAIYFKKVSLKDKVIFAKQISTMLEAGLQLSMALEILTRQTRNQYFRRVLTTIHRELEEGKAFSQLLARFPNVFDKVFVNVVRAGEQSGKLDVVLKQLAKQLYQQFVFLGKIKNALIYPVFVLIAMVAVALLATVRIVPQLKIVFDESNLALPISTRIVVEISDFVINYWLVLVIIFIGLTLFLRFFVTSNQGRQLLDGIILREPTGLTQKIFMARFARTMAMMIGAGVPIVESVKVVSEVMGNAVYKRALLSLASDLERGLPMSVPLQKNPYFPILVSQMILVGEQTGKLDTILVELANFYEEEAQEGVNNLASLFEPLVIVIIGIGIGFLVYSIIIPIYNLAQVQ